MTAKNTYITPRTEVLPIRLENAILDMSPDGAKEEWEAW